MTRHLVDPAYIINVVLTVTRWIRAHDHIDSETHSNSECCKTCILKLTFYSCIIKGINRKEIEEDAFVL